MEHSYKYFENRACKYFPCHEGLQSMNCLFCYCPLYSLEECPGDCTYIEANGKRIKECTNCTFPHMAENYEVIHSFLQK